MLEKYITVRVEGKGIISKFGADSIDLGFRFTDQVLHANMLEGIKHALCIEYGDSKTKVMPRISILGAGFCRELKGGSLMCFGEAKSLEVKSRGVVDMFLLRYGD